MENTGNHVFRWMDMIGSIPNELSYGSALLSDYNAGKKRILPKSINSTIKLTKY